MDLASVVKNHRKKSKLSQAELAELAGVGKTVVYDIEKGKQSIRFNTLLKVLKALNITIKYSSPLLRSTHE